MTSAISSIPNTLIADSGDISKFANDYRVTRAVWLGSFAIVLYDWGLTFRQEVQYMQRIRMSGTKFLFIMNRYWPMILFVYINIVLATPGISDGLFFELSWPVLAAPMHASIGTILIIRIYVMYACDKRMLWTLSAVLIGQLIAELAILLPIAEKMTRLVLPAAFTGCIPSWAGAHNWAYWVPMATFELALFILAVAKSVQLARSEANTPRVLSILLRDSVFWFGGVMVVILTNLIIWATARQSLFSVAIGLSGAAHSILGCRMLLNIHDAVQPTFSGNASIFATNFTRHEQPDIPMRPMKSSIKNFRGGNTTYEEYNESTVVIGSRDMVP